MARNRTVSDEDIRQAVLDLVCDGVSPVTAQVRARLLDKIGCAGATDRISRVTAEVVSSLGALMRAPVSNPNIPSELVDEAGKLVGKLYASAMKHAQGVFDSARAEIQSNAREAVEIAEQRVRDVTRRNDVLTGKIEESGNVIRGLGDKVEALGARNEDLSAELLVARASHEADRKRWQEELENAKSRINELERVLQTRADQSGLDMDMLVARVAQAMKENTN